MYKHWKYFINSFENLQQYNEVCLYKVMQK